MKKKSVVQSRIVDGKILFFLLIGVVSCGSPARDAGTALGRKDVLYAVNMALTAKDCASAVTLIDPLFNSSNSNNEIRMLRASAYGCDANINFFKNLGDIGTQGGNGGFSGTGFWGTTTALYPSSTTDRRVEAGVIAQDTLMTALKPGQVLAAQKKIFVGTLNPGSLDPTDRITDANVYLFFTSLATFGGLGTRYGLPDSGNHKTQALPWTSATAVTSDGCTYISSLLNIFDAVGAISKLYSGSVANALGAISTIQTATDLACSNGCTACGLSCSACPTTLRDHTSCTGVATNIESCAAAGVVTGVNATWL